MDRRILIAAVVGLVLVAFGAVYFAIGPSAVDTATSPAIATVADPQKPQGRVIAADIEADITRAGHGELQALLKRNFPEDYKDLVEFAVRRRNEGVTDAALGEELNVRFRNIMRPKLKSAAAASVATIDKLAKNELSLFHTLGTNAPAFCLALLGREAPPAVAMPEEVLRTMRLGTLYRFQAIVEGMPKNDPAGDLTAEELSAFEAALLRNGLRFEDVRSGAFLNQGGSEPGKPCLMVEKLHTTIASLPDQTRRKLYAGMYFFGRDK